MCGIAGFYGNYQPDLLSKMGNALAHRGPDDSGSLYLSDKKIGLLQTRLSIIDLTSGGHQPMWDADHKICIVFNGEIYNYQELKTDLLQSSLKFKSDSDTEVILNLYLKHGVKCLEKLNGIFAFALWDSRQDILFVARDDMGVKPLYYATPPEGFLFASEIKAIIQSENVSRETNPVALKSYVTYLWAPSPLTPFKHIHKLEPGHAMILEGGKITRQWKFYDLPYDQPISQISEQDAAQELDTLLTQAVRRQMVADVPVGAFLSGGLDSSAIVAKASKLTNGKKLACFTIDNDDDYDKKDGRVKDLPYAQKVAKHLDVDLSIIKTRPEMWHDLPRMIWHMDEPQPDMAALNVETIARAARKQGIKVLLSGAGGDDIFTGYKRHYALSRENLWNWMPKPVLQGMSSMSGLLPTAHPTARRLAKLMRSLPLTHDDRIISYFEWLEPKTVSGLFTQDFADEASKIMRDYLGSMPANTPDMNKMLALDAKFFLTDHNLNYTDKLSMAAAVETRVPLLDPDLVAFAARLPINLKQRGSVGKYIFKKAMERELPMDVIYRPKAGFGVPLRQWLKGPLRDMVEDVLSKQSLKSRGIFNPQAVRALIDADRAGRVDASFSILSMICIEYWMQMFVDGKMPVAESKDGAKINAAA